MRILKVHSADNVAVALEPLQRGEAVTLDGNEFVCREDVPRGHKIAICHLHDGQQVMKYGHSIGHCVGELPPGTWVHSHNLKTNLSDVVAYRYEPAKVTNQYAIGPVPTFRGYRRANGRVGTRNEIWIINTVGCVNTTVERVARKANELFRGKNFDGVYAFSHPFGCSQLGDDLNNTRKILAGLMRNPNAGAILVMGLGCENNQRSDLLARAGDIDPKRIRSFNSQTVDDEIEEGIRCVGELFDHVKNDTREECPIADLVLGMKCGGSDGFSGITANPLVGRITDTLVQMNGRILLTEVPEMFGAEQQLMNRAKSEKIYQKIVHIIDGFKEYFLTHNQPVYENPSPGNKEGGLTTLEEKSLGAVQKGGSSIISDVLEYGEPNNERGLVLLKAPGNDGISSTAMTASGATMLLFTTGRGTPLGFPVPTVKIASNTSLSEHKPAWIDFNAGEIADGSASIDELSERLLRLLIDVASGDIRTKNEMNGYKEIAIWKEGVTL